VARARCSGFGRRPFAWRSPSRPLGLLHGLAGFDLEHAIRGLTSRPQAFTNSRAEPLQIGVAAGALIIGRGIDLGPFHRMRVVPDQEFKDPAFRLGQAAQARVRATLIRMANSPHAVRTGGRSGLFREKDWPGRSAGAASTSPPAIAAVCQVCHEQNFVGGLAGPRLAGQSQESARHFGVRVPKS
jgi:cytochrome c553